MESQKGPEHELGAVAQSLASIGIRIGVAYLSFLSCQPLPVSVGLRPLFKSHPLGNEPVFFASSADRAPSCK